MASAGSVSLTDAFELCWAFAASISALVRLFLFGFTYGSSGSELLDVANDRILVCWPYGYMMWFAIALLTIPRCVDKASSIELRWLTELLI